MISFCSSVLASLRALLKLCESSPVIPEIFVDCELFSGQLRNIWPDWNITHYHYYYTIYGDSPDLIPADNWNISYLHYPHRFVRLFLLSLHFLPSLFSPLRQLQYTSIIPGSTILCYTISGRTVHLLSLHTRALLTLQNSTIQYRVVEDHTSPQLTSDPIIITSITRSLLMTLWYDPKEYYTRVIISW